MDAAPLPTINITPEIRVSRILHGLWQVADIEKDGHVLDPHETARFMQNIVSNGFTGFDMADHYGSAEIISGTYRHLFDPEVRVKLFTKWCPEPGYKSAEDVNQGISERLQRLQVASVDLLQFHWWRYDHPGYLDCLELLKKACERKEITALGLTNFDTDHLRLALADGIPVKTNQVCFSLLDRRAAGRMSTLALQKNVKLLCYGVLAGGFLSDKWLDTPEPDALSDWSKSKYKRFIDETGGWTLFQSLLQTVKKIADRYRVGISQIAARWVLEQPATGAVIIGARLGENDHSAETRRLFDIPITARDLAEITQAADALKPLPGDCGDEYRAPPFLTASGDLSHHLSTLESACRVDTRPNGDKNAVFIEQSHNDAMTAQSKGTSIDIRHVTAIKTNGAVAALEDPVAQAIYCLDKIGAALNALEVSPVFTPASTLSVSISDPSQEAPIRELAIRRTGLIPIFTQMTGVRQAGALIEMNLQTSSGSR